MVVVVTSEHVARDAFVCEGAGHRRRKADSLQCRVNLERQPCGDEIGFDSVGASGLKPNHNGQAFVFSNRCLCFGDQVRFVGQKAERPGRLATEIVDNIKLRSVSPVMTRPYRAWLAQQVIDLMKTTDMPNGLVGVGCNADDIIGLVEGAPTYW
jgi:hypothetical protein